LPDAQAQHWTILGPGAIGSLWAMYLGKSGHSVSLVGHKPRSGTFTLIADEAQLEEPMEVIKPEQLSQAITHLLVTTKAQDTLPALNKLRPLLLPGSTIVVLQNGMAALDVLEQFPEQTVYAAVTTEGAYRKDPFTVVHAGRGKTYIGALNQSNTLQNTQQLCQQLAAEPITLQPVIDIVERLWKKLAINCAVNALTVKYDCRNGELLDIPEVVTMINGICEEVRQVANALKLTVDFSQLEQDVSTVLQATAKNYSSMYQDVRQQRGTEIDYINGYLCRQAEHLQISCPLNQKLVHWIKGLPRENTKG
jgi:2-dehydropantoate 2-reductase